jgi:cytoskeletal protein CcmA (bactofilin family)
MALWGKKAEPAATPAMPESKPVEMAPAKKEIPMALAKRDEDLMRGGGEVNAVLGRGTEFDGKLTFEGEVRIAGRFNGEIFSKDRLQVDDGARVQAEITAGTVIVYGEIIGNIKATSIVELKANAKVKGNIETPALMIEKGVMFEGSCKMENLGKNAVVTPLSPLKPVDEKK